MNQEAFDLIKREMKYIGLLFLIVLAVFKIVYFKENMVALARIVLSLFWLFLLPGYSIMLYWREKIDFTERIVAGIALSAAVIGIFSYYIGLLGLNIKYHGILLPLAMMIVGFFIIKK